MPVLFGVPLAYVLARARFPGRSFVRALVVLPMVLPPVVAGYALLLAFRVAELVCRREAGEGTDEEERLLRVLTPLAKLTTAKQAVTVASEVLESFGGAGYVAAKFGMGALGLVQP